MMSPMSAEQRSVPAEGFAPRAFITTDEECTNKELANPFAVDMGTKPRPIGVTLLAVWEVLSGLQLLVTGLVLWALSSDREKGGVRTLLFLLGILFVILAFSYFLWARGYLKGYEWARRRGRFAAVLVIVLAVMAIFLLGNAVRIFFDSPAWTIIANIVIAVYLGRPKVKAYFGSRSAR